MENLKEEVERIIKAEFPDSLVELEIVQQSEKISGEVVTKEFAGRTQRERSELLRNVLLRSLDAEQRGQISLILTLSPAEHSAILTYG